MIPGGLVIESYGAFLSTHTETEQRYPASSSANPSQMIRHPSRGPLPRVFLHSNSENIKIGTAGIVFKQKKK